MNGSLTKVAFALLISMVPAASVLADEASSSEAQITRAASSPKASARGIIGLPPIICIGTRQQPLASLQVSRMTPEIRLEQLVIPVVFERIENAIYQGVFEQ